MTGDIVLATARPYLALLLGLLGDYAISRGWLQPDKRQMWVDGWIQLISASGSILLGAIVVWHEFQIFLKKTLANQTTTVTTTQNSTPPTTTTVSTNTTPSAVVPISSSSEVTVPLWNQP